jgi:5'-methylthioadenosine phosphorylase
VVRSAVGAMPKERACGCANALQYAILTDRKAIPPEARQRLALLLDKYM